MKLKGLGEFSLINRLTKQMRSYDNTVILGIGDDAAAFRSTNDGKCFLVTCDMLVEGHHFSRDWITPEQLGHKALAVSLSDIAAMGGIPRYCLISAGWPSQMNVEDAEGIYRGMGALAEAFGVFIIGGDTVSAPQLILDVTVIGEMKGNPVTRNGAKPGDLFAVTGTLGTSAAGLALLEGGMLPEGKLSLAERQVLLQAHLQPQPRIREACILMEEGPPSAMIDISDGLASEIHHICESSGVGAEINQLMFPVNQETKKTAQIMQRNLLDWALYGGEDYELLVTLPENKMLAVKEKLYALGVAFTLIGFVTDKSKGIKLMGDNGSAVNLEKKGYDHFSDQKHKD